MAENRIETSEKDIKQYIVARIGNEKYGIDIRYIDNIVRMQKITRVPKSQAYFKGIINLRGEIVPVMSIRTKMGLENDVFTNATRIIILKIEEKAEAQELFMSISLSIRKYTLLVLMKRMKKQT